MGYYTNYYLTAKGFKEALSEEKANQLAEDIRKSTELEDICSYDSFWCKGYQVEASAEAKWYDCEDDMYELSKRWPDVLFDLTGNGEESTDIWEYYFLNGEVQKDGIVIERNEFNRAKLKPYRKSE